MHHMRMNPAYHFLDYETTNKVKILNPKQAYRYIQNGAELFDHYADAGGFVWVFDAEETRPLFEKWCRRELA